MLKYDFQAFAHSIPFNKAGPQNFALGLAELWGLSP